MARELSFAFVSTLQMLTRLLVRAFRRSRHIQCMRAAPNDDTYKAPRKSDGKIAEVNRKCRQGASRGTINKGRHVALVIHSVQQVQHTILASCKNHLKSNKIGIGDVWEQVGTK